MAEEFNKDRTARQIVKLGSKRVFRTQGLVETILDLNQDESLELRAPIIAPRFQRVGLGTQNTRKAYKHGWFMPLSQPESQGEAFNAIESPLQIRARDFDSLMDIRENEIQTLGFSFHPVQGKDRETRVVPFVSVIDGMRLYSWISRTFGDIKVENYTDAKRAAFEGGEFVAYIPSRTRKRMYRTKLSHVPVVDNHNKNAITWSLDSNFLSGSEPEFRTYNIFFNSVKDIAGSDKKFMYPQEVAAMIGIAESIYNEKKNSIPLSMNVFPIPSHLVANYDCKLRNNVVIYDPTIKGNNHLRKLHLAERSIMHARLIGKEGHDKTMFWNANRDPKLKDYAWNLDISV